MRKVKRERIPEPILVTGATGFIGRRLIHRLLQDDYRPRAFVLPSEQPPKEWEQVEVARGDVTKRTSVTNAMDGVATVFHLAAMVGDWGSPEHHQQVTVRGTENVLGEAAQQGARALLASSVVVYGVIHDVLCEEDRPMGKTFGPYSRSKQAQERIARSLEASDSLKVTVIRPTNVYGPGSVPWVDKVVEELKRGSPMLIGGGRRAAGLTYVDNVVDVFVRAAERPASVGRTYNASDDNGITWLRYFTELAQICQSDPPKSIPKSVAKIAAYGLEAAFRITRQTSRPPITHEALNLVGSNHRVPISRAMRELEYKPPVSYAEGMKAVAHYVTAQGRL